MAQVKIPFNALIASSLLVLLAVNMNTRAYGVDGKPIEGAVGDPKIEVVVLDTFDRFSVTVKNLDKTLANMTEDQILASLKSRQYINVTLENAFATPFPARSGYGVSYSVKADSAKTVPAPVGFGAVAPPPKA